MKKKYAWLGGLAAFVVVVGSCNSAANDDQPTATSASSTSTTSRAAAPTVVTPPPVAAVAAAEQEADTGERITVSRVIDGDTFELADGRRVRVLGIDSCEMKAPETYGGEQAKSWAEGLLARYKTITMTAEPAAPDTDRYGRLLRYVQVDGEDFGVEMVKWDHTGIYDPKNNDASRAYLDQLYAADLEYASNPPSGRDCGDPYPTTSSGGGSYDSDDDDHNMRDGALTGGYCARKWWC